MKAFQESGVAVASLQSRSIPKTGKAPVLYQNSLQLMPAKKEAVAYELNVHATTAPLTD